MAFKDVIVYSNVWEDPELNKKALLITNDDIVLSITSGGCNSLNLLLENPKKVISIDTNPAQNYLLELKKSAIFALNYDEFIKILGVEFYNKPLNYDINERIDLYNKCKKYLSDGAQKFWDKNIKLIKDGIIMCGKVEKFFKTYRKILMFLYGKEYSKIEKLFFCPDVGIQKRFYESINFKKWHFLNWLLLNKKILSLVKGSHSFKFVEENELDKNLNKKVDYVMTHLDNKINYFCSLILLGKFLSPKCLPPYLIKENFENLKSQINKLEIFTGTITDVLKTYGSNYINKFNLSNIFEWMENDIFNNVIKEVIELATNNARICFKYTLAKPRILNDMNKKYLISEEELAQKLHKIDRSFMYESFHVYKVIK